MSGETEGTLENVENTIKSEMEESTVQEALTDDSSDSNGSDVEYVYDLESGFYEAQGRRDTMEDTHVVINNALEIEEFQLGEIFEGKNVALYGVFDGHGGNISRWASYKKLTLEQVEAAQMAEELLPRKILGSNEFTNKDIEGAIYKGFEETDQIIIEKGNEEGWMNGSTAVVGVIVDDKLYMANIGDSEACLVSDIDGDLQIQELTVAHKASDPDEKKRIEELGGHVFFGRVFGTLAVSRSFGDHKFKQPKTIQNFVSWEPALAAYDITPNHTFLVIACDGLWDVMTHEEVAQFVTEKRKQNKSASEICKELVQLALHKKTEDNVTIVLVFFNWKKGEPQ